MEQTFCRKTMQYFQYLVDDYKFEIGDMSNSIRDPRIEGNIEYHSSSTFVSVSGEIPSSVSAMIGRVKDVKYKFLVDSQLFFEFFSLDEAEKKLVLSHDPKDDYRVSLLLDSLFLYKKTEFINSDERLDYKLSHCAVWLRKYAEPFLSGDFSQWLEIYKYKVEKTRADYHRNGKDTSILYLVKVDENKKPIYEKKSIFQNSLDYLDHLREE